MSDDEVCVVAFIIEWLLKRACAKVGKALCLAIGVSGGGGGGGGGGVAIPHFKRAMKILIIIILLQSKDG